MARKDEQTQKKWELTSNVKTSSDTNSSALLISANLVFTDSTGRAFDRDLNVRSGVGGRRRRRVRPDCSKESCGGDAGRDKTAGDDCRVEWDIARVFGSASSESALWQKTDEGSFQNLSSRLANSLSKLHRPRKGIILKK